MKIMKQFVKVQIDGSVAEKIKKAWFYQIKMLLLLIISLIYGL